MVLAGPTTVATTPGPAALPPDLVTVDDRRVIVDPNVAERRASSPRWLDRLALAVLVAFATLTATGGSPWWRAGRPVLLLAVGLAVGFATRAAPRLRALGLLLLGVAGTAAGAGIGPRALVESGVSIDAVAGLVALLGGLALLGSAIVRLGTGLDAWLRTLVTAAAVIGSAALLLAATPAVVATNVPAAGAASVGAPPDPRFESVSYPSRDGVELSAWYLPSQTGAVVVLRHGAGSTRTAVVDHALVLADHGYGVLLTDARGHGRSEGDAMDFGWYGDADITAAIDYLSERSDVDPDRIGVVGLSMGAEEAIGAAATDPRVAAVVAEGATGRTDEDKAWLSDTYGWRGAVQEGIEWVQYGLTDLLTAADEPIALAPAVRATAPRPVLLIAADQVADEVHVAESLQAASPSNVTVWVVEDAGHTTGLRTDPQGWEDTVVGFLDESLI